MFLDCDIFRFFIAFLYLQCILSDGENCSRLKTVFGRIMFNIAFLFIIGYCLDIYL